MDPDATIVADLLLLPNDKVVVRFRELNMLPPSAAVHREVAASRGGGTVNRGASAAVVEAAVAAGASLRGGG